MNGMLQVLRAMGPLRLAIMGVVAAALLGSFAFLMTRMSEPPMALLYGGLDLQDSAQIVAKLEGMKVPYELRGNGSQILVPDAQALRLRMSMAEDGLPAGGSIGYEIFDRSNSLGTTNFVQNINHLRALEGELSRTIRAIDGVLQARVHLVLPKREVFSRESRDASASIVLKMRGHSRLEKSQVQAIQNLVAAAVPDLKPSHISIVDEKGTLLARGVEDREGAAAGQSSLSELRASMEERLKRSIEALLERSVGPGNVRAEVTADIDFDRITTNQELFDPDGQVVRSTQTVEENSNSSEQDAANVSVSTNLPEAQARQNSGRSSSANERTEETVNYEISKTVRTQVREAGVVRRLSVAVLVNEVLQASAEGGQVAAPRTEAELNRLSALVRSAIGFDAKRGDTVEVVSMRFTSPEEFAAGGEEDAGILGFGKPDLFRMAEILVTGVVVLLVLLLVVRPLVARMMPPRGTGMPAPGQPQLPSAGQPAAIAGPAGTPSPGELISLMPDADRNSLEAMIDIARVEGQVKASSMKKIGEIVEKHPEEAVAIMRNWLYQDA